MRRASARLPRVRGDRPYWSPEGSHKFVNGSPACAGIDPQMRKHKSGDVMAPPRARG